MPTASGPDVPKEPGNSHGEQDSAKSEVRLKPKYPEQGQAHSLFRDFGHILKSELVDQSAGVIVAGRR